jgi:hypothetical protein
VPFDLVSGRDRYHGLVEAFLTPERDGAEPPLNGRLTLPERDMEEAAS